MGKILKDLALNDGEVSDCSASHTTGLNELEIAKRRNLQLERLKKERNEALDALNRKEAKQEKYINDCLKIASKDQISQVHELKRKIDLKKLALTHYITKLEAQKRKEQKRLI